MNRTICAALAATLLTAPVAHADDTPWCSADPVDRFQYLRRLSLDLRQRAPDLKEYQALINTDDVPADIVDRYLASPDFEAAVRAYHRDLLWPNLQGALMFNALTSLEQTSFGALFVRVDERSLVYRGAPANQSCADRPQTDFEADGTPIPGPDGLDGWVMVEPYWAPGTQVKVCAYEAQDKAVAHDVDPSGRAYSMRCDQAGSFAARKCGCGPNLAYCMTNDQRGVIRDSFVEQELRLVDNVVLNDRPYTDLLLARDAEVNGPVAHYLKWQGGMATDVYFAPDGDWTVPDVPYTDRTWTPVTRGALAAGVLTLPGYLLKFQTNRARAHRFHIAFLCQDFSPPPGGLILTSSTEPNVAKRPGCSYCHQTLEPAASWWGRYSEQGASFLDPAQYPIENAACEQHAWQDDPFTRNECLRVYISGRTPEGILRAYEFARDGTPEGNQLATHAGIGPRGFAEEAISDGRFARCTVTKWFKQLLRRDPNELEMQTDIPRMVKDFQASNYKLKGLIKEIVTSPAYRRAP